MMSVESRIWEVGSGGSNCGGVATLRHRKRAFRHFCAFPLLPFLPRLSRRRRAAALHPRAPQAQHLTSPLRAGWLLSLPLFSAMPSAPRVPLLLAPLVLLLLAAGSAQGLTWNTLPLGSGFAADDTGGTRERKRMDD